MLNKMETSKYDKVAILDAGAQYSKVIDRKIRELEIFTEILDLEISPTELKEKGFKAIVISGGPGSVYDDNSPKVHKDLFTCGLPILGICYGFQLICINCEGKVIKNDTREDGQYEVTIKNNSILFKDLANTEKVLLTHQDICESIGSNYEVISNNQKIITGVANDSLKIYGVQFHPEVDLTLSGQKIFKNFLFEIAKLKPSFKIPSRIDSCIEFIKKQVGNKRILMLMSGGVDSAVCCALLHKALGTQQVVAVHIDNGFMRKNESTQVVEALQNIGVDVRLINAQLRFGAGTTTYQMRIDGGDQIRNVPIGPLNQVTLNPEEKRKIIGDTFMHIVKDLWKELATNDSNEMLLGQGTLRPDLIESASAMVSKKADAIKTHHNDTDLVRQLRNEGRVIEPLVDFHKDEVRQIGRELGLPENLVNRQPFPGPGLAVRVICAQEPFCERDFTETSSIIKIIASYNSMSQKPHSLLSRIKSCTSTHEQDQLMEITNRLSISSFVLPIQTVGVQGDCRTYSYPCVLSTKLCTTHPENDWQALYFLARLIPRICSNINRVVYVFGDPVQHSVHDVTVTYLREPVLALLREADYRATQALQQSGQLSKISQMPVVIIPIHFDRDPGLVVPIPSVLRSVVLRPFITADFMTGLPAIPGVDIAIKTVDSMVQAVSQVPGISRVLYDLTSKPPGTTEWE